MSNLEKRKHDGLTKNVINKNEPTTNTNVSKKTVRVVCDGCGYEWLYRGRLLYPTCPSCHKNVRRRS